jgi:hypothetical protein
MFNEINEWLSKRCGKFTASEIHKLTGKGRSGDYFGLVAKTYIATKAAELMTLEPANQRNPTMAMEWGTAHEYEAMTKFKEQYGHDIEYFGGENPTFFEYSKYAGGSPDGLSKEFIIEIKCPFNSAEHLNHMLLEDGEDLKDYAPEYYWQMTANMIFTGKKSGIFISFDPRFEDQYQLKTLYFNLNLDDADFLKERIQEAEKHLEELLSKIKS